MRPVFRFTCLANDRECLLIQELVLDDNGALRARAANMSLPKVRMFRVPLTAGGGGYEAAVRLYLPPEITFETFTSFPLLVQV